MADNHNGSNDDYSRDLVSELKRLHGLQMDKAEQAQLWRHLEQSVKGPLGAPSTPSRGRPGKYRRSTFITGLSAAAALALVAGTWYATGGFRPKASEHFTALQGPGPIDSSADTTSSASKASSSSQWKQVGPTYLVRGMVTSLSTTTTFDQSHKAVKQLDAVQFQMQQVVATAGSPQTQQSVPFATNSTHTVRINEPLASEGSLNLGNYTAVEMNVAKYVNGNGETFWGTTLASVYAKRNHVYYDASGHPFVASSQYWSDANPDVQNVSIKQVFATKLVGQVPDYKTSGMTTVTVSLTPATKVWDNGQLRSVNHVPKFQPGQSIYVVAAHKMQGSTVVAQTIYGPSQQILGRVTSVSNHVVTLQELRASATGPYQTHTTGKTLRIQYNNQTFFQNGASGVQVEQGDVLVCQVTGNPSGLLLAQGISVQSTQQLSPPYAIGSIQLGESFGQVAAKFGQPTVKTTAHGQGGPEWKYEGKGIMVDGDPVWNLLVTAPFSGATTRGIHIGSTESAVKKAYPTAKVYHNGTETSYAVFSPGRQVELMLQCKSGKVYLISLQQSLP